MFVVLPILSKPFINVIYVGCLEVSVKVLIQVEIVFSVIIQVFKRLKVAVASESNLCDNCDGQET